MKISRRDWNEYSEMLARLSRLASDEMQTFLESHGIGNTELIVDVAHALVTKYGEASAAAACNLYDEIAEKQGKAVRSAEPAETASREKTAGAVYGSLKDSPEGKKLKQVPDRLVKQAAADTMLQNAKRDGAEWAWIPSGDGCAMCMTIASRGWLPASSAQLSGGHASHIHANCKCQFAIRFDKNLSVEGYDPDELKRQYDAAEGSGSRQKINYLRRKQYEKKKKTEINYAKKTINFGKDYFDREFDYSDIEKELNNTEIGRQTLEYLNKYNNIELKIDYNYTKDDTRAEQQGDLISLHMKNISSPSVGAQTLAHEITHHRFQIGQCQYAEAICFGYEKMLKENRTFLYKDEWEYVKQLAIDNYSDIKWKKKGMKRLEEYIRVIDRNK